MFAYFCALQKLSSRSLLCHTSLSPVFHRFANATTRCVVQVGVEEMTRSSRRLARDCISECVAAALDARARQRNSERWSVAAAMLRGPSDGRGVGTDAHSSSHGSTTPPRTSSCPLARGPDTSPAPRRAHSTRATKGRDSLPQSE